MPELVKSYFNNKDYNLIRPDHFLSGPNKRGSRFRDLTINEEHISPGELQARDKNNKNTDKLLQLLHHSADFINGDNHTLDSYRKFNSAIAQKDIKTLKILAETIKMETDLYEYVSNTYSIGKYFEHKKYPIMSENPINALVRGVLDKKITVSEFKEIKNIILSNPNNVSTLEYQGAPNPSLFFNKSFDDNDQEMLFENPLVIIAEHVAEKIASTIKEGKNLNEIDLDLEIELLDRDILPDDYFPRDLKNFDTYMIPISYIDCELEKLQDKINEDDLPQQFTELNNRLSARSDDLYQQGYVEIIL